MRFSLPSKPFLQLLIELGTIWFFLFFFRLLFLIQNHVFFPDFGFYEYIVGSWFDLITIALFFFPYMLVRIVPLPFVVNKYRKIVDSIFFIPPVLIVFFFNAWDIAYFSFTRKRISFDYFKFIISENEASILAGDFLAEFWWLLLIFILTLALIFFLFFKLKREYNTHKDWRPWLKFVGVIAVFIVVGRGGFQLKPVGVIEATNYCSLQNAPAVLNSAFTILKTLTNEGVERKTYFNKRELNSIFNPVQVTQPRELLPNNTNVVFILFESYGAMYVGPGNKESYTPYLDGVLSESMYFEHGVANSRTSMDGLPAAVASIPTWMNESFILSSYSMNQYQSLPSVLKNHGYSTAFFHSSTNGSMRFDAFSAAAGFDHYYGRSQYPYANHYDGNWGIPDHYFLPWSIDEINKLKKPFFSMVFTISSHHPYKIPKKYKALVKKGPDPICEAINYADYAFHEFWEKAKKQDWFDHTLFVFCADHVGPTSRRDRASIEWSFKIPIAYYHSSGKLPEISSEETSQQIDIMPTVLDLLNINTSYFAMGTSYFSKYKLPKVVYNQENFIVLNPNKKSLIWNDRMQREWSDSESETIRKLKAIYQHYTHALIDNKMLP